MQGLAPADQYRGLVTRGQADAVGGGGRDPGKTKQRAAGGSTDTGSQDAAAEQVAAEKQGSSTQGAGADETAAAQSDELLKIGRLVFF